MRKARLRIIIQILKRVKWWRYLRRGGIWTNDIPFVTDVYEFNMYKNNLRVNINLW